MSAAVKAERLSQQARAQRIKPRPRAVKRRVIGVDPVQLSRAIRAINRADKRNDWFDFLRYLG